MLVPPQRETTFKSETTLAAMNNFSRRAAIFAYQHQGIKLMQKSAHYPLTSIASLAVTLVLASSLAACGGGGSSSSISTESAPPPAPAPAPTPTPTPTPEPAPAPLPAPNSTLQTWVPEATYAAKSAELDALQTLNQERANCSFGLLRQNELIDKAAKGHADYIAQNMKNPSFRGIDHYQDPSFSGFTGVSPSDRAKAAGYAAYVGEVMSNGWYSTNTEVEAQLPGPMRSGEFVVRKFINSIYHMAGILSDARDVGIAVTTAPVPMPYTIGTGPDAKTSFSPAKVQVSVINQGSTGAGQKPLPDTVQSYPCEGSRGLMSEFGTDGNATGETPDPFVGLRSTVLKAPSWGHPLYFFNPSGGSLIITSAQLTDAAGVSVPLFHFTHEVDPHRRLTASQVFLIPLRKLDKNASYFLQVQGQQSGKPFAKAFHFSTGEMTPLG